MYIKVRVKAGSKKESVVEDKKVLVISVTEKAERNMANKRVRELLVRHFEVPLGSIRLVSGHHHPIKMFSVNTRN